MQASSDVPLVVSMRMNDLHHLEGANAFLNLDDGIGESKSSWSRRIAALSPTYLGFMQSGAVISKTGRTSAGTSLGSVGEGAGCSDEFVLDFTNSEVINTKYREARALLLSEGVRAIVLDFTRSSCFFVKATPLRTRSERMNSLLERILRDRDQLKTALESRTDAGMLASKISPRHVQIILRLPIDEDPAILGLSMQNFTAGAGIDAVIISRSKPVSQFNGLAPVAQLRGLFPNASVYGEIFQLSDAISILGLPRRERRASFNEIMTLAYELRRNGVDGFSLFNFHYLFPDNSDYLSPAHAFQWHRTLACLQDDECLIQHADRYYFSNRYAEGQDLVLKGDSDTARVFFRLSNPDLRITNDVKVRVQLISGDLNSWRNDFAQVAVEVNGVPLLDSLGQPLLLRNISVLPSYDSVSELRPGTSLAEPWMRLNDSKQVRIPAAAFRNGMNSVVFRSRGGSTTQVMTLAVSLSLN